MSRRKCIIKSLLATAGLSLGFYNWQVEPYVWNSYKGWILSGHTHGGQAVQLETGDYTFYFEIYLILIKTLWKILKF